MSGAINFFWHSYLNLENEFLRLSEFILIDDEQLNVYSLKIGDLLVHAVTEIETITKALYAKNGGDMSIDEKDRFFDTVCMAHLNDKWCLEKKVVNVVAPVLYLSTNQQFFQPLKKANKRGTSSADWNKAYQGVKHDRANNYKKGNIKVLLHALGALFVLNLYYKDNEYLSLKDQDLKDFDLRFGSSLFAVKVHKKPGIDATGIYKPSMDYDECVYIEDYEDKSKEQMVNAIKALEQDRFCAIKEEINSRIKNDIVQNPSLTESEVSSKIMDYFQQLQFSPEIFKKISRTNTSALSQAVINSKYKIILNKQQYNSIVQS